MNHMYGLVIAASAAFVLNVRNWFKWKHNKYSPEYKKGYEEGSAVQADIDATEAIRPLGEIIKELEARIKELEG